MATASSYSAKVSGGLPRRSLVLLRFFRDRFCFLRVTSPSPFGGMPMPHSQDQYSLGRCCPPALSSHINETDLPPLIPHTENCKQRRATPIWGSKEREKEPQTGTGRPGARTVAF